MKKIIPFLILLIATACSNNEETVAIDGAELHCRVMGSGTPIICLHGGPGLSHDYLLPGMEALAENHKVVFYDQRGCGQSTGDHTLDEINIERYVEDLEALRQHFGFDRFALVGHSFGGLISMKYAITYPDGLSHLVIVTSAPAHSDDIADFYQNYARMTAPVSGRLAAIAGSEGYAQGDADLVNEKLRLIYTHYLFDHSHIDRIQVDLTDSAAQKMVKVETLFQNFWQNPYDLTPKLSLLNVPTLVVHADHDLFSASTPQRIADAIPSASLITIANCGHFPYVEQPDVFLRP